MLGLARPYGMARGIYYVAPYGLMLFFIPFLLSEKIFTYKNTFFIILLLSQFGFSVARIINVSEHKFPIYPLPYAFGRSYYFPEGHISYDWNLSRFDSSLVNCHRIYIDVPNEWQEYFIVYYLYSKNIEFVKKYPVKTTFWAEVPLGYQTLNGKEDCVFSTIKKTRNQTVFHELRLTPYQRK